MNCELTDNVNSVGVSQEYFHAPPQSIVTFKLIICLRDFIISRTAANQMSCFHQKLRRVLLFFMGHPWVSIVFDLFLS